MFSFLLNFPNDEFLILTMKKLLVIYQYLNIEIVLKDHTNIIVLYI